MEASIFILFFTPPPPLPMGMTKEDGLKNAPEALSTAYADNWSLDSLTRFLSEMSPKLRRTAARELPNKMKLLATLILVKSEASNIWKNA